MKTFMLILSAVAVLVTGWHLIDEFPSFKTSMDTYLPHREVRTLEARYSPEQVVQNQYTALVRQGQNLEEPKVELYPFLLMNVKYVTGNQTREGQILWSLSNAEMVLDIDSWKTTHGFQDFLHARASRDDFRILNTLAQHSGQTDREHLIQALRHDSDRVDQWVESCKKKQLVIQRGNNYRLHIEKPSLPNEPATRMSQPVVNRRITDAVLIGNEFSSSQIIEMAKSAFGSDFSVRYYEEVYLPVYNLTLVNPDESSRSVYFNALTSQPFKK